MKTNGDFRIDDVAATKSCKLTKAVGQRAVGAVTGVFFCLFVFLTVLKLNCILCF